MTIEYRYVVTEGAGYIYVIAKVCGKRFNKTVTVPRNRVVRYNARMSAADWDKMARTESEARSQWIALLEARLANAKDLVQQREGELISARKTVGDLEVKELR